MKNIIFILLFTCGAAGLAAQGSHASERPAPPTIGGADTRSVETTTNTSSTDVSNRPGNPVPDITVIPVVHPVATDAFQPDIGSGLSVGEPVTIDEGFEGDLEDYLFITNREDFFRHGINLASTFQRADNEDSAADQMKGAMATIDYTDTYKVRRLFNIQAVLAYLFYKEDDTVRADEQIVNALTVEQRWLDLHQGVSKETLDLRMKIGHDFYGLEFYTMAGQRFAEVIALANSAENLDPAVRKEAVAHAQYMMARMNTIWGKTETAMHLFEQALQGGALEIRNSNTDRLFQPEDDPAFVPLQTGPRWGQLKSTYDF